MSKLLYFFTCTETVDDKSTIIKFKKVQERDDFWIITAEDIVHDGQD